MNLELA